MSCTQKDILDRILAPVDNNTYTINSVPRILNLCVKSVLEQYNELPPIVTKTYDEAFLCGDLVYATALFLLFLPGHPQLMQLCLETASDKKETMAFVHDLIRITHIFLDGLDKHGQACQSIEQVFLKGFVQYVDYCRTRWVTR